MKSVSVIIPVYNAAKHLEQCVRSVMNQTLEQIEIICVDDGSSDDSLSILKRLADEDPRIVVLEQKNAGAGAARNRGLEIAEGEYLSFLDADDFFKPDMLEKAYGQGKRDRAQVVVFGADFYDDKRGLYVPCGYSVRDDLLPERRPFAGTDAENNLFRTMVGWAWDKLFLNSYIRESGLRFQEQRTSNDLFFVYSALAGAKRITTREEVLAHQRRHVSGRLSVTREKSWMCFYHALLALRDQLKTWKLYEHYERSFVNYALHFSLWNLNTLGGEIQGKLYERLRNGWLDDLGVTDKPKDYFESKSEYRQMQRIMREPYNPRVHPWLIRMERLGTVFTRGISALCSFCRRMAGLKKALRTFASWIGRGVGAALTTISPALNTQVRFAIKNRGKFLNLKDPKTFTEKLAWLKLNVYAHDPVVRRCADKLLVRDYIREKGLEHLLNPLYAVYDRAEDIKWEELPNAVAVKWNYGCGFNLMIRDKANTDLKAAEKKLAKWGKRKYWKYLAELQYRTERPCILCERYLATPPGEELIDYKFYCFGGEVKAVLVIVRPDHADKAAVFMNPDWTFLSEIKGRYARSFMPEKPASFEDMLYAAKTLSADFPFVRVDFFDWNGQAVFGEMTFTPAGGMDPSQTQIDGKDFGEYLHIDVQA